MDSGRHGTRNWRERRCQVRNWRGSRSRDSIFRPSETGQAPSLRRWLHALQDFGFAQRVVARLGALEDALDYLIVHRKTTALQPEKNIRFSAHRADVDDLFEAEVVRGHAGIHGVREFNIFLLVGLHEGSGVNAGGSAERVLTNYGIVRRNRNAGGGGDGLTISLEFGQVLPIPRRDAHELQVDQHLVHLRVADAFSKAENASATRR